MLRFPSRRIAAVMAVLIVTVPVAACAAPGPAEAERVADWLERQRWVLSADAHASSDYWAQSFELTARIDPGIPDDDLRELAVAADRRAVDAGWTTPWLTWEVGTTRSFSNRGGAGTLEVFLGLRHDARYLEVSARGDGECGGFFCTAIASRDPAVLGRTLDELTELADSVGGIPGNLEFGTTDASGRFAVVRELDASVDDGVALWMRIAAEAPLEGARVLATWSVGEAMSVQQLDLEVADEETRQAAERIAATQTLIAVTVTVTELVAPSRHISSECGGPFRPNLAIRRR